MRGLLVIVAGLAGCGFDGLATAPDGRGGVPGDGAPDDSATIDATDASTTLDGDGDGIVDADDNCPALSNTDQHDWDGDHHGDACDGCPHLSSVPDPDGDGDGVGDACDPRPGTAGDARVVWLAF